MKVEQILKEALEPEKRSPIEQLKQIVSEFHGEHLFVHMGEIEKLGVNPNSPYNTPLGIYSYPSNYVIEESYYEEGDQIVVPFAEKRPYVQVFNQLANIIDNDYSNLHDDLDKFILKYGVSEQEIYSWANETGKPRQLGKLWNATRILAEHLSGEQGRNPVVIWNELFRKDLNYDAVVDWGDGIIHESEPTQAVHFSKETLEHIDTIFNSPERDKPSVQTFKQLFFNEEFGEVLELLNQENNPLKTLEDREEFRNELDERIRNQRFKNPEKVQSWINFIKENRKTVETFSKIYRSIEDSCETYEMFAEKAREHLEKENLDIEKVDGFLDHIKKFSQQDMPFVITEQGYELYNVTMDLIERFVRETENDEDNQEIFMKVMKNDFLEPNPIIHI